MEKGLVLLASPSGISIDWEIGISIAWEFSVISMDREVDQDIVRLIGRLVAQSGDREIDCEIDWEIVTETGLVWLVSSSDISTDW